MGLSEKERRTVDIVGLPLALAVAVARDADVAAWIHKGRRSEVKARVVLEHNAHSSMAFLFLVIIVMNEWMILGIYRGAVLLLMMDRKLNKNNKILTLLQHGLI